MITIEIQTQTPAITVEVCAAAGGTSVHNELTGRDAIEAHPGSAIGLTGVDWDNVQQFANAVQDSEVLDDALQFFSPEQTTDFTITSDMLMTEVTMNSATDLNVTLGSEIPIGKGVMIRRIGAGKPVFVAGVDQNIETYEIADDSNLVIIERIEDVASVQQYRIIQGQTG